MKNKKRHYIFILIYFLFYNFLLAKWFLLSYFFKKKFGGKHFPFPKYQKSFGGKKINYPKKVCRFLSISIYFLPLTLEI
jgi:hypothetical protein